MTSFRCAVLIVTCGKECVFALLKQLSELLPPEFPVMVADNSCSPSVACRLAEYGVEVITLEHNTGGAGGFRAGMACYEAHHAGMCEFLWLLDDDAVIDRRTLPELAAVFQRDGGAVPIGAAGSAICMAELPGIVQECGSGVDFRRGKFRPHHHRCRIGELPETEYDVEFCPATSLLIRREALSKTGYFADIFLHFDDVDWCFRARAAGYRIVAAPGSRIFHPTNLSKPATWVRYYDAANEIWFCRRRRSAWLTVAILRNFLKSWYFRLHQLPKTSRLYRLGIFDALRNAPRRRPEELPYEGYGQMAPGELFSGKTFLAMCFGRRRCCRFRRLCPRGVTVRCYDLDCRFGVRLLRNLAGVLQAWISPRTRIVLDDEFRSRFVIPVLFRRVLFWNFNLNEFVEKS